MNFQQFLLMMENSHGRVLYHYYIILKV